MATKFWRVKYKGKKSVDEIQAAVGKSGGLITRVHFEGDSAQVYFAGDKSATKGFRRALRGAKKPVSIGAKDVMRFD